MPGRPTYVEIEPLSTLPAVARGAVTDIVARRNARAQTSVQGVLREPPRAAATAGAGEHQNTPTRTGRNA